MRKSLDQLWTLAVYKLKLGFHVYSFDGNPCQLDNNNNYSLIMRYSKLMYNVH